jgi:anti-sigma regulatory factor (Ser/Thr protein kinase)
MINRQEKRRQIMDAIRAVVAAKGAASAGEIAAAAGLTRQAIHNHLAPMMASGELQRRGAGRGTRYYRAATFAHTYSLDGLEEDRVWKEILASTPVIAEGRDNVRSILTYAFTEMLNNAIEHSGGSQAHVLVWVTPEHFAFEVEDDGVGIFEHLRRRLRLPDHFAALQQLTKGRQTTDPEHHTGQGIFFTSKCVDYFEVDGNGLRWLVDNVRRDQAVGEGPERIGTRVRCEIAPDSNRTTKEVFDEFTDDSFRFSRSRLLLRLFETGEAFVSRSEARRIASELEAFEEVEIDFEGVKEVGQGFVDELFRVWARDHPGTKLVPKNASPTIEAMLRRGLPT